MGLEQRLSKPEKGRGAGGRQGRRALPPGAGRQAGKTCKESNLQPPENKCTSSTYTLQLHQEPGLLWHANVLLAPGEKEALKHKVRRVRPQAQDINSWKIMQVVRNLACLVAEHLSRC